MLDGPIDFDLCSMPDDDPGAHLDSESEITFSPQTGEYSFKSINSERFPPGKYSFKITG